MSLPAIAYTDLAQAPHGHYPDPDGDLHVNAGDADVEVVAGGVAAAVAGDVALPAAAVGDEGGYFERHSVSARILLEHCLEAVGRMILAAAQLQPSSLKSHWG